MVPVSQRRRVRATVPRERRRNVRFSDDEMAGIRVAAQRAHLTETGFIAESAVQAAFDMPAPTALSTSRELAIDRLAAAVVQLQNTLADHRAVPDMSARIDWMCDELRRLRG
jgi:uncharacterized protein (DUF1778 family)